VPLVGQTAVAGWLLPPVPTFISNHAETSMRMTVQKHETYVVALHRHKLNFLPSQAPTTLRLQLIWLNIEAIRLKLLWIFQSYVTTLFRLYMAAGNEEQLTSLTVMHCSSS
jgi:hypothetical protein